MKHCMFLLIVSTSISSSVTGQVIPEYDLGGASRPVPELTFRKAKQYKRVHQTSLRLILRGELDKPEAFLNQYLKQHPNDPETLYMQGILYGQRGNVPRAERTLESAIKAGLPDDRIIAGPRQMMKPLHQSQLWKRLSAKYATGPVHGPLIGNVTHDAASFWVRTTNESHVQVIVSRSGDAEAAKKSNSIRSRSTDDFTGVVRVSGLEPNTQYRYAVRIDDGPLDFLPHQTFRTQTRPGVATKFTIAFGGGAGYVPENERMWTTIQQFDPHAVLLLGDNVYIDDPESVVMQQYTYHRRQSRPEWRKLTARSPVFCIWDDHDFSTNDSWGGPDVDIPFWKKDWVLPTFRQNWVNPGYGGDDSQPGCWYSFSIGDVDFIMLDCRYYRTDPQANLKSMLGPVQKTWLKQQLKAADGTFKVLCSSVPWDFRTKGDSLDTWNGYRDEHEEILSFIESEKIEGVLLMSADRHRSDAWKIDRPNGYGLYEFNSSRLTNQHVHPTMEQHGALFSYNALQSFGLVTFDTTQDDPQATYDVVNIDGQKPFSITVHHSELTFP